MSQFTVFTLKGAVFWQGCFFYFSAISLLEKLRPKEHAILHQGHEVSGKVSGSETQSWLTPVPKLLFTILGIRVQFDFRAERGVFTLYHFIYFRHPRRLILPKGTQRVGKWGLGNKFNLNTHTNDGRKKNEGRKGKRKERQEGNSCVEGPCQGKRNLGSFWLIPQKWNALVGSSGSD